MARTRYTAAHWGIYEVERAADGRARMLPYRGDPDPSPIGLYQLDDAVARLRVRRPAVRRSWLEHGPGAAPEKRGREPFVEVAWQTALDLVAAELDRVRGRYGNAAIFGGSYGWSSTGRFHHAQSQVHRFLNTIGGYVRHVDTYSVGAGWVIMPHVVATMDELQVSHTSWDVLAAHTGLFVTFGGVALKNTQISSGGAGEHRVRAGLRRMAEAGVRFVNISPVRDDLETGGPVEWVPIRPNTDTALMLALAYVLETEGLADRAFLARYCTGYDTFRPYLLGTADGQPKTPDWAAAITGVPAATIAGLARQMAAQRTMVNVAWALQRATHGEQPFWMVVTLAAMLGQIGLPGGGFGLGYGAMNTTGSPHPRFGGPVLPQGNNRVSDFIPVARIADMLLNPRQPFTYNGETLTYPDIRLVYWAGGNPFHHHQDLNRLRRAWQVPDSIVVHEQYWTPTAKHADVVLPATTSLERNDIGFATREGHLIAMEQVNPPLDQARDDFRIFAGLAERLGSADAYTEGLDERGWLERLYTESAVRAARAGLTLPPFAEFWEQGLLDLSAADRPVVMLEEFRADPEAHRLTTPSGRIEIFSERIAGFGLADCPGHPVWLAPAEWLGGEGAARHPLHLISDQPVRRLHGQLDHSPHSLAGKIDGREPVYLNPHDAAARGIRAGQVVELFNDRGRCLAAAILSEDIAPGVARLSTGAWFDPEDDGAAEGGLEKHGNPNVLTLDHPASALSQGCAAHSCLVDVVPYLATPPMVTAHGVPEVVVREVAEG
jgi:biotin/methionine sulfoxide reductase